MGRFGKLKKTPAFFLPANAKSIRSSTLAQKDEISSTEKLLDLIRDHTTPPSSANKTESSASPPKHGLFDSLTFQKPIGIGVEIGNADIRVAKINRISDTAFTLLDYGPLPLSRSRHTIVLRWPRRYQLFYPDSAPD
jgi:hypothetical protein